jgi:hypothetical protein
MTEIKTPVRCNNCGILIDEPPNIAFEKRKPCSSCGSLNRKYEKLLEATISMQAKLGLKAKRRFSKKPFLEVILGADLYKKTQKWMQRERIIDREKDLYREVVTDPKKGEIIHKCEEPLSEHVGHGSAKKRGSR